MGGTAAKQDPPKENHLIDDWCKASQVAHLCLAKITKFLLKDKDYEHFSQKCEWFKPVRSPKRVFFLA